MHSELIITVTGTQPFMGKEIPVVLGGFGPNARCVCDKTVAEIHDQPIPEIRRRIGDNIERFTNGVDYIDLKIVMAESHDFTICSQLGYSQMQISKAEHIYAFSERGYAKLAKILDTDQAWDIYEHLLDEYFQLRATSGYIVAQEDLSEAELMAKALAVAEKVLAKREARIASLEAKNSALTVKAQIMAPKADYFDELVERNTLTNFRETAKQLEVPPKKFVTFLLERKYIYRDKRGKLLPYQDKNDGLFEVKEAVNTKTQWSGTQTLVTPKGRETFRLLCQGL